MKQTWHILLVEDDPDLGPTTVETLVLLGHRCQLADTVSAAYSHLSAEHNFEIILLDLQLGSERGEMLIERLRGAGFELPPVFIFSAQPDWDLREALERTCAKGFIRKPATGRQIHAALSKAFAA